MKSFKWMIAAGIMLIAILLLSLNYSTGKLNASPVKPIVQQPAADQDMQETDFPLTIGIKLFMLY